MRFNYQKLDLVNYLSFSPDVQNLVNDSSLRQTSACESAVWLCVSHQGFGSNTSFSVTAKITACLVTSWNTCFMQLAGFCCILFFLLTVVSVKISSIVSVIITSHFGGKKIFLCPNSEDAWYQASAYLRPRKPFTPVAAPWPYGSFWFRSTSIY